MSEQFTNITSRLELRSAKIIFRNGLARKFYTYVKSTTPTTPITLLDFSKIAETLYDIPIGLLKHKEDIEITLSSEIPVGVEYLADRIPIWLVINVTTIGLAQHEVGGFDNLATEVATRAIELLTDGGEYCVFIDVDSRRYIISTKSYTLSS